MVYVPAHGEIPMPNIMSDGICLHQILPVSQESAVALQRTPLSWSFVPLTYACSMGSMAWVSNTFKISRSGY